MGEIPLFQQECHHEMGHESRFSVLTLMSMVSYRLCALGLIALHLELLMFQLLRDSNSRSRRRLSKKIDSLLGEATQLLEENMTDMDRLEMVMAEIKGNKPQDSSLGYN
jgi:hypothetical protein